MTISGWCKEARDPPAHGGRCLCGYGDTMYAHLVIAQTVIAVHGRDYASRSTCAAASNPHPANEEYMTSTEYILERLSEQGFRVTGPRRTVLDAIGEREGSFSADDLLQHLETRGKSVGRATVFRTLDLLVQQGVLDRLHRPDGCHTYVQCEIGAAHHHHLVCSDCGVVVEFEECTVQPLLEDLERRTEFTISGHWLEVFGQCAKCRAA